MIPVSSFAVSPDLKSNRSSGKANKALSHSWDELCNVMKNLRGGEYECSRDEDDCDVMGFKNKRKLPKDPCNTGSRVNQSSPTKQENRYVPLLEWSNNKT